MAWVTIAAGCVLNDTDLMAAPAADSQIALQMHTLRNIGTLHQQLFLAKTLDFGG
jgi:hypothetical protein